jgi:hypothetical protein
MKLDYKWQNRPSVAVPPGVMVPFNTQNTIQLYDGFWGLFLPITVAYDSTPRQLTRTPLSGFRFRVTDIWRGYFQQRLLWEVGGVLVFVSPIVYQDRNDHDLFADYIDEDDLYKKSGDLIDMLLEWKPSNPDGHFFDSVLELSYEFYLRDFWGYEDVLLASAWLQDLIQVGYVPPIAKGWPSITNTTVESLPPLK